MIDVKCSTCQNPMPLFAHASAKFCSERCRRRTDTPSPGALLWRTWKHRRRAKGLPAGERATPSVADIVQRDGLVCHICGEQIDYTLIWKDPDSLTVDHLIPVSDVRSFHGLENLKLAHRRCNILRGDHIYNERLAS